MNRIFLCIALLTITLSGCSNIASIQKTDGEVVRTRISSSDQSAIYVNRPGENMERIPRSEIESITHPGTYSIPLGGVLTLAGVFCFVAPSIFPTYQSQDSLDSFIFTWWVPGTIATTAGILTMAAGWNSYSKSSKRASNWKRSSLAPIMLLDENNQHRVGLGWHFTY